MKFSIALLLTVVAAACSGCRQTASRNSESEMGQALEDRIIKAVREWYVPGREENVRVVVESRSPSGWKLKVGPEMKETTVEIDPATLQVVKVWLGY